MSDVSWVRLRELAQAATNGPWFDCLGDGIYTDESEEGIWVTGPCGLPEDQAFVAAVSPDVIQQLLTTLEAREEAARDYRYALESLLEWARRYRGGDPSLDWEEWYVASEYAANVLGRHGALAGREGQ